MEKIDIVLVAFFAGGIILFFLVNVLFKHRARSWCLLLLSISFLAMALLLWRNPKPLAEFLYTGQRGGTISPTQRPFWRVIGILFFGVLGILGILATIISVFRKRKANYIEVKNGENGVRTR